MKQQVSKDIVVAALITDTDGNVLIVKPNHKDGWIFPGGYVEVGEAPSEALRRELVAELGLATTGSCRLLSVDYRGNPEEYVMFIFDGGVLTPEQKVTIKLPPQLLEYQFVAPEVAQELLRTNSSRRLMPTLEARQKTGIAYLENQSIVS